METKITELQELEIDISAVIFNDFDKFVRCVQASRLWREIREPSSGNTLLQQVIKRRKIRLLRYLLDMSDVEYLEKQNYKKQTAITVTMEFTSKYPVLAYGLVFLLVQKYEVLPSHYDETDLLTWSMTYGDLHLTKSLLKKGLSPNARSAVDKPTALHQAISSSRPIDFVLLLLSYGADPWLTYNDQIPFELSLCKLCKSSVVELLFEKTFDRSKTYQMKSIVLVKLAHNRSPLFHRIQRRNVEFVPVEDTTTGNLLVELMLNLDEPYLQILNKKYLFL